MFSVFKNSSTFLDSEAVWTMDRVDLRVGGMIDVDATFFIQFGIFVLLIIAMKLLVYDSFLSLQDRRDQATGGAITRAKEAEKTVKELKVQLDEGLAQAMTQGTKIRDELRGEAESQAHNEVSQVSGEMETMVEAELAKLKDAETDARARMIGETDRLAGLLADRVMGV